MPTGDNHGVKTSKIPGHRQYNRQGGRPELTGDFEAVCDAVLAARKGSGETITDIANRFGVSRGWIHKWVYLVLNADGEFFWFRPQPRKHGGWGTGDGSGVVSGTGANSNLGPPGSSLATPKLA